MEQMYNDSLLPPLPTGGDVGGLAVGSVWRRGFYDGQQVTERYPLLTAQYCRLTEEVGELAEAIDSLMLSDIASELADVMIVLCQLAWLSGMNPDVLLCASTYEDVPFCVIQSKLYRSIRKDDKKGISNWIVFMACQCDRIASTYNIDLRQAMRDKIARDEQRGIRHEGNAI